MHISAMLTQVALVTAVAAQSSTIPLSGSHTNIPRWCGKPYMEGAPDFPPGGMLHPPLPSADPTLFVQLQTRHTIYDSSESQGSLIVMASISHTHGESFHNHGWNDHLNFEARIGNASKPLVSGSVDIDDKPHLFDFDLDNLESQLEPYEISLYLSSSRGLHGLGKAPLATTELYYLPHKTNGSTVKVDNLYGGLLVANEVTNFQFEPFLSFGFYTSCSGYLNNSLTNVTAYKDLGFNAINPVCALTDGNLSYLFDWLDETNLWYQYDMRGSYLNLSSVAEQVPLIKDRSALLTWYTADEPDGWQYALNTTRLAYDLLKKLDPYHPTALVLNCANYYFKQYSSGADYIMEDAYPVGIDPTYSHKWNTTCNITYGDCGCDDCVGSLTDVSNRLDTFFDYQEWLGEWQKPLWAVLQAFYGEEYWSRDPTVKETWAMILLSFNHKAKGIMSWVFPASNTLNNAHSAFAKVATVTPVSTFLLGSEPVSLVQKSSSLDVSYWGVDDQYMVGIVNLDASNSSAKVEIELPFVAHRVESQPWGSVSWKLTSTSASSTRLTTENLEGLGTSIVIMQ